MNNDIHPAEVAALIHYDPEAGVFTWKARPASIFATSKAAKIWNKRFAGRPTCTTNNGKGYLTTTIHGRTYKAHRIAWAIFYGSWPVDDIDHVNHKPDDNRISNLRSVSRHENLRNRPPQKNNTSGHVGVYWNSECEKWTAAIGVNGQSVYLGLFERFDDAVNARTAAQVKYGFHPNGGGNVSGRI